MKKKATFSREQLSKSKTFGYGEDLVKAVLEEKFPNLKGKVQIFSIGATIGSHSGPGTLALFFWGDERKD